MSGVSDYGSEFLPSLVVGLVDVPASYWLALLSRAPTEGMSGTDLADIEPSGASYARQEVPTGPGLLATPDWESTGSSVINGKEISFGELTEDWEEVGWWALTTAETDGEVVFWSTFSSSGTPYQGQVFTVPPGGLVISVVGSTPEAF